MKRYLKNALYSLFPFIEAWQANKKVKKLLEHLGDKEFDNSRSFNELRTEYEDTYKRKDRFEDKAKSNIISVTITVTLIMGSLSIIKEFTNGQSLLWINGTAILLFAFAVFYMIIAGVNAFSSLMDKNTVFVSKLNETNTKEIEQAILGNNYFNAVRNNLVNSSYRCIKNALVCMFLVMLLLILNQFDFTKQAYTSSIKYDNTNIFYSSGVLTEDLLHNDKFKLEFEDFILDYVSTTDLIKGKEIGIIDSEEGLFIKLVKCSDGSIQILLVEEFSNK